MLYQLTTGKVVYISDEDFFNLSDEEFRILVQDLAAHNRGHIPCSYWHGSAIRKIDMYENSKYDENDADLDMRSLEELDDDPSSGFDINNIPDEEPNQDY